MNIANILGIFERRKQFWDDFEKKYAIKQAYETRDYKILECDKYWPDASPLQNFNTKGSCCKQKNAEDEVMYDDSSVLSNQDDLSDQENNVYGAEVDSSLQNAKQKRKKSESALFGNCSSLIADKLMDITKKVSVNVDTQISKTEVKHHKEINKIAIKRIPKIQNIQIRRTKHTTPTKKHDNLALEVSITAQDENDKTAVKIQSKLQHKTQYQVHTGMGGDINLPSGNIKPAPSGLVKASEEACGRNYSKSKEKTNGISGHTMENTTIVSGTVSVETAEVTQRYTRSQSKLRKQDSVNMKNIPSVCKNIPLNKIQRKSFTESIKANNNLDIGGESCNSQSISGNENNVINENRSNNSTMHRPENSDSSSLTSASLDASENQVVVSNMEQILENCIEVECNKTPQTNGIGNVSTTSIATLNDAIQTGKSNTDTAVCASVTKSNIMHLHEISMLVDNDLHVIHKSDVIKKAAATFSLEKDTNVHSLTEHSSPNLLQRNEEEANKTNFEDTKHKAFMNLLHADIATSSNGVFSKNHFKTPEKDSNSFNDKFTEKSSVDRKEKVQNKMDQSTEGVTEKICRNNCLAKLKQKDGYTSYITRGLTADVAEDVLNKLRMKSRKSLRKRFTRFVEKVLSHRTEQVLSHSLSKVRNSTEEQNGFTNKNEKLDEISDGGLGTNLNHQCTNKLVTAECAIRISNHRPTENTKKRTPNNESNSRDAEQSNTAGHTAVLGNACNDSDHSVKVKQGECYTSKTLSPQSKAPVKLSEPFLSNYGENCLQTELSHSIKTVNMNDKPLTKTVREEESTLSNDIKEQLCENVSEKYTNCRQNTFADSPKSSHDEQNKDGTTQVPLTDSLLEMNHSAITTKSNKTDICRNKAGESNEINGYKRNSHILAEAESIVSQSKQHMAIQRLEEHRAIKNSAVAGLAMSKSNIYCEIDDTEKQSKPSAYETTNVQNKSLEKPPSHQFFKVPCPTESRKRCARNDSEAHNSSENLTNEIAISSSTSEQLQREICKQNSLRNKTKGNIKEGSMKPFASKRDNNLVTEENKSTTTELEQANSNLKEKNRHRIGGSGLLCTQGTRSGSKHKVNKIHTNIKQRKLSDIADKRDVKDYTGINLTILESSVCTESDCNEFRQQSNKYFVSGSAHTQSRASNKPLSQLLYCTPVSFDCNSNLSSTDCVCPKMLTNFSSESWSTFQTRVVNDLQTPLLKKHKLRLLYRK